MNDTLLRTRQGFRNHIRTVIDRMIEGKEISDREAENFATIAKNTEGLFVDDLKITEILARVNACIEDYRSLGPRNMQFIAKWNVGALGQECMEALEPY